MFESGGEGASVKALKLQVGRRLGYDGRKRPICGYLYHPRTRDKDQIYIFPAYPRYRLTHKSTGPLDVAQSFLDNFSRISSRAGMPVFAGHP